jgi:hypothetical protein
LKPYDGARPFRAVVVVEEPVSAEWRAVASRWLVDADCLYMMAWGHECSLWDDSVDFANLEVFNFGEVPDRNFVMIFHVSRVDRRQEYAQLYAAA